MPIKKGLPPRPFPNVARAREALADRAVEVFESILAIIAEARAAGNLEVASKTAIWLAEHMPKNDGQGIVDRSVDRDVDASASGPNKGLTIQIGLALGGLPQTQKQLTEGNIIEVETEVEDDGRKNRNN